MTLPTEHRVLAAHLRQPDQRTCGPSCLVVAHMLNDAAYADGVLGAPSSTTRGPAADSFRTEVLRLHRRANAWMDGRPQLGWPRTFGLAPWAAARLMTRLMTGQMMTGQSGRPRRRYRARVIARRRATAYVSLWNAVHRGHVVPLYVGSRWVPRHVVLAVANGPDGIRVYEPASGRVVTLAGDAFAAASLDVAGWSKPWFVVLPRGH